MKDEFILILICLSLVYIPH